jgi:hypothetical protein
MTSNMTVPKNYLLIFNLENEVETIFDIVFIPGTSVEMTFLRLDFLAIGE